MHNRDMPRRHVEHRDNPKHHLDQKHRHDRVEPEPRVGIGRFAGPQPNHDPEQQQQIAGNAVHELDQACVFKEIPPNRLQLKGEGRQERPGHQGPVVIGPPRINPSHQRTEQDLQKGEMQ